MVELKKDKEDDDEEKTTRIPPSRNPVRRVCRSRISRSLAHHSRPVGRERRETRGERFSSAGVSAKETGEEEKGREKNEAQLRETEEFYELKEVPRPTGSWW